MESQIQARLIKYLRGRGFYVIKTKPGPGVPVGCPDVFAFNEGWWTAFEVKSSAKAPFQPLQERTLKKLGDWSSVWVVYPENYDDVISELEKML